MGFLSFTVCTIVIVAIGFWSLITTDPKERDRREKDGYYRRGGGPVGR